MYVVTVFQILLLEALTPERCLEAYHLHRTRLELIAERKASAPAQAAARGGLEPPLRS
jgi:hypothetical protein